MRNQEPIVGAQISPTERRRSLIRALLDQSGQDLIEYALLLSLVGLAATAGMQSVASKVSAAYSNIGTVFVAYIGSGNSTSPGSSSNGNGAGHGQGNNGNNSGNGNNGDNGNGTGNGNNGNGKG